MSDGGSYCMRGQQTVIDPAEPPFPEKSGCLIR